MSPDVPRPTVFCVENSPRSWGVGKLAAWLTKQPPAKIQRTRTIEVGSASKHKQKLLAISGQHACALQRSDHLCVAMQSIEYKSLRTRVLEVPLAPPQEEKASSVARWAGGCTAPAGGTGLRECSAGFG